MMFGKVTLALFAYCIILLVAGASIYAVAAVGGLACFWQLMAAAAAGVVPDAPPPAPMPDEDPTLDGLTDDEYRTIMGLDEDEEE
jgi:hypothetical protein